MKTPGECASFVELQTDNYLLTTARIALDLEATQRLRYEVFNLELGEGLVESRLTRLDADRFDPVCDHLLVREIESGEVVGTYRLQSGASAARNLGYYSEIEFDFAPFEAFRSQTIELGRACVARAHRNQTVIALLWKGIVAYTRLHGGRYLVGCSSLTSQDPAAGLAAFTAHLEKHLAPPPWRTSPQPGWACESAVTVSSPKIPRLMSAYLALGAWICGAPAIDREFKTIDFLTCLDLTILPPRVMRKFLK